MRPTSFTATERLVARWSQCFTTEKRPLVAEDFLRMRRDLGIQPSAAGPCSVAARNTRNMFCWLLARICTTSPWSTLISSSFTAP
ncbi:hypothetical protein CRUP_008324 [Coryphaenoides rupestris]|nr:hypothetical protein CRUP_008324 [Coryphaenoides rupestris]